MVDGNVNDATGRLAWPIFLVGAGGCLPRDGAMTWVSVAFGTTLTHRQLSRKFDYSRTSPARVGVASCVGNRTHQKEWKPATFLLFRGSEPWSDFLECSRVTWTSRTIGQTNQRGQCEHYECCDCHRWSMLFEVTVCFRNAFAARAGRRCRSATVSPRTRAPQSFRRVPRIPRFAGGPGVTRKHLVGLLSRVCSSTLPHRFAS